MISEPKASLEKSSRASGEASAGEPSPDPSPGGQIWRTSDGEPVSCVEKIKVLNQNLEEIHQMCQDALEDAVLMGCDEAQFKGILESFIRTLKNPYTKK